MPPDLPGNPVAEFNVTLLPGGDILDVRLSKSSGHAAFDNAVERAIFCQNHYRCRLILHYLMNFVI